MAVEAVDVESRHIEAYGILAIINNMSDDATTPKLSLSKVTLCSYALTEGERSTSHCEGLDCDICCLNRSAVTWYCVHHTSQDRGASLLLLELTLVVAAFGHGKRSDAP